MKKALLIGALLATTLSGVVAAPASAQECHPAYEPCIPLAGDLDCPDVVGPITVITPGNDPYRLDRDGDGIACEGGATVSRYEDAATIDGIVAATNYSDKADAPVLRLYRAYFNRRPDVGGAKYWLGIRRDGFSLVQVAGFMAGSREFADNYAGTTNAEYVAKVYTNVLGRTYDQAGYDYWLDLLDTGQTTRVTTVFYVTANKEFISRHPFAAAG